MKKDLVPKLNGHSSTIENSKTTINNDLGDSPVSERDGTPRRPIVCLKTRDKIKEVEETEDCFILEFDPYEISKLSVSSAPDSVDTSCDLRVVAEKGHSPVSEQDEPPLRPIFCLKTREKIKEVEETEDCFILEFDPYEISKLSISSTLDSADTSSDLCITAEKGQLACRDYPHSRHLCLKYRFEKTPHERFCELCYCFVCNLAAPCTYWTGTSGHCHAVDNDRWKNERKLSRQLFRNAR